MARLISAERRAAWLKYKRLRQGKGRRPLSEEELVLLAFAKPALFRYREKDRERQRDRKKERVSAVRSRDWRRRMNRLREELLACWGVDELRERAVLREIRAMLGEESQPDEERETEHHETSAGDHEDRCGEFQNV